MSALRTDELWFVSPLNDPEAKRRVLAGKPIGANRLVAVFDTAEEAEAAVRKHNTALNENGPASAPTLPDRGSNNPCQENAVNVQHDTTKAVAPATTECPVVSLAVRLGTVRSRSIELDGLENTCRLEVGENVFPHNYYSAAHAHSYQEETSLQDLIALTEARSLEGAAIQIVEALWRVEAIWGAVPESDVDADRDRSATVRLLHSAMRQILRNCNRSPNEIVSADYFCDSLDPWTPVEERVARIKREQEAAQ